MNIFNLEATKSVKNAHRLNPSTLDPKSIEKTSVKLAVAVFCESTRDALRFYSNEEGKTDFIVLIIKLWNIMNVKSRMKGKHKRDYTMDPVRHVDDWKLGFLGDCQLSATVGEFEAAWLDARNISGTETGLSSTA